MNIPNLVYKSLDVRYTVFFYNYTFRDRDDVGACCNIAIGSSCNTLTVKQIGRVCGVNRTNCDTSTNVACDISIVIKYILSDLLLDLFMGITGGGLAPHIC